MLRSLHTAATGMISQQTQIDVTSNNIANVNTAGYKKSRAEFADLMYQVMKYAGTSTSATTLSPSGMEVGLGVRPSAITKVFTEGYLKSTSTDSLDMAIEGNGFFKFSFLMAQPLILETGNLQGIMKEISLMLMVIGLYLR